jgi:NAD(P)H-dependent FMN reductase
MKKIIAIGASNSEQSINKQLATWAAQRINDVRVEVLDLNDFEMPIFSMEREQTLGIPAAAQRWKKALSEADGIIISFAEHNSSYTVAFKNILDWASRMDGLAWQNKPMLLLATSPGPRGAQTVLATAESSFPFLGGKVAGSFSLPSFNKNFNKQDGIVNSALRIQFEKHLDALQSFITGEKQAA